ncbi:MAG: hypothetical protein CSYNP_02146 [Syntrophus sp. SKADARSKE-3]|nr:hypothetical protein [Syntrophus sp. SKADARSKE-3]
MDLCEHDIVDNNLTPHVMKTLPDDTVFPLMIS